MGLLPFFSSGCFSWCLFLLVFLLMPVCSHVGFSMCRFLLVLNLQFLLVFMPVSPCLCASFSSSLCQCLLVLEWVSPCSCASFSSSFASFFLSLQGVLLFPVSHCPPAGFSLSSGLICSCPHVGFSLSLYQFLLIHILVSSRSGSSLCQFLLVRVPVSPHPYSGFFLF